MINFGAAKSLLLPGIGAVGQAWWLFHELAHTYPYKIMSHPPAEFYETVGWIGLFLGPTVGIAAGLLFGRKRDWLCGFLPALLCPMVFAVVFLALSAVRQVYGFEDIGRNFDDTDRFTVAVDFLTFAFSLAAIGSAIALGFGLLKLHISTTSKNRTKSI